MKLPNGKHAVVDIAKLRKCSLNLEHGTGKHKARVFVSAIGLRDNDAEWLREVILERATVVDAVKGISTQFGDHYVMDFELRRIERTAIVRTSWIILRGEVVPRLVTCFVR